MTAAALDDPVEHLDPRRWLTLAILLLSMIIVVLDTTVLNVAIPTILHDFNTELPSLQWVITGYSLTFATFLIIGGRLGDIYGARRMFIIGAALFGLGSLLASEATSVPSLLLGESLIEGIGASLMLPATLAIMSITFEGAERAKAFAVWGATAGAGVAFGPAIGGFLTTNYSWRWSFRINLVVAPIAVIGALLFMKRRETAGPRQRVDLVGALLVATGTFSLVFALSEAALYGWITPTRSLSVLGWEAWPADRPISAIPLFFVAAVVLLGTFYWYERRRERERRDPLFEFSQLRHLGFRYGLLTTAVLAMGQLGFLFVLPVFLQGTKHLSAVENGLWLLPSGLFIVLGAQIGGRLTRRINTTLVVRYGLALEAVGLLAIAVVLTPDITFPSLLPGFALFGIGLGFASSQLTNVVLSDIPNESAGAASGANTTVRQIGAAIGIAVIGSLLTTHGARPALLFASTVVTIGAALSLLIPMLEHPGTAEAIEAMETIDPVEALDALSPHQGRARATALKVPSDLVELNDHMDPSGLLGAMGDPVVVVGSDASLVWANRAAEARFGWTVDAMAGQPLHPLVHPDDLETALLSLESVQGKETGTLVAIRVRDASGEYAWFEVRGRACPPDVAAGAVVLNLRERSGNGQWALAGDDAALLRSVIDAAPALLMLLDPDGTILSANRAFTRLTGRSLESALGTRLEDLVEPAVSEQLRIHLAVTAASTGPHSIELHLGHVSGHTVPLRLTMVNLLDDRAVGAIVVTGVDISQLVDARAELEHRATHDDLTGLANRTRLRTRLGQILGEPDAMEHSLLFADVDGLKGVNDRHGHQAGDAVLSTIAHRLRSVTRREDLVARVSGDEFVIIVASSDAEVVAALQERINSAMLAPVTLPNGRLVTVSVSVGVAGVVEGVDIDELLAAADAAMYLAKRGVLTLPLSR